MASFKTKEEIATIVAEINEHVRRKQVTEMMVRYIKRNNAAVLSTVGIAATFPTMYYDPVSRQRFVALVEATKTLGKLLDEYQEDPTLEDFCELVEGDGS